MLCLQVPLPRRAATRASRSFSYPKGLLTVTARARRDRVTWQISNRTSRLEAIANLPCTPSALAVPIIRRGSSDVLRSESERSVLSRTNAAGVNNQLRMRYDFASGARRERTAMRAG